MAPSARGLYNSNLLEELIKVLSNNAFPVAGVFFTHQLALEGLTVVLDGIDRNCQKRISDRVPRPSGTIRNDEIVMPAEQTELVKESYEWKQLLVQSGQESDFLQMDHGLLGLTWGPGAALSYIFGKRALEVFCMIASPQVRIKFLPV
jgi:hypothetical protein